jgi:hypothetical protein
MEPLHCKKGYAVFPSPAGMSLSKLSVARNTVIQVFPARESLVSDILAGEGKIDNKTGGFFIFFFLCTVFNTASSAAPQILLFWRMLGSKEWNCKR